MMDLLEYDIKIVVEDEYKKFFRIFFEELTFLSFAIINIYIIHNLMQNRKRARIYKRDVSTTRGKRRLYSTDAALLKRIRTGGALSAATSYSRRGGCSPVLKYKDYNVANTFLLTLNPNKPFLELLPGIQQGSGDGQRDGMSIHLKKIDYKLYISDTAARATTPGAAAGIARVNIWHDTQANSQLITAAPDMNVIMLGATGHAMPDPTKADRFKLLRTKFIYSNATCVPTGNAATYTGQSKIYPWSGSIRFGKNGKKIMYTGNGNDGAAMVSDNIYVSAAAATGTNDFSIAGTIRVWFYP